MGEQLDIFGGPLPTREMKRAEKIARRAADKPSIDQRWAEFHTANPHVFEELLRLARARLARGETRISVKARREEDPAAGRDRYRIKSLLGVERSLRRAMAVELQLLAKGTPFLATTAAASPFIGLFGTVWGIMVAFNDIGSTGSTSIVAVAPGIAEALVNTAAGLAAAIPALVGYNYFGTRLRALRAEMDDFILEFMNLTERNFT